MMEKKKHYKLKPIPGMWGILFLLTIGLGIAMLCGAPIHPLWLLAPLGIPIALIVTLPIYALIAIIATVLVGLAFLLIGCVPLLVIAIMFGISEKIDDVNDLLE